MKYFFFSVFFIIVVSLIIIYIKISNYQINDNEVKFNQIKKIEKEENSIINALNLKKNEIILPAKELYLRVDLNYNPKIVILYQLILEKLNKYVLFGIEQILKLNNIKYSVISSKNNLKLFINFDKKRQAKKISELFKSYNFNVRLREIKIQKGIK